MLAGGNTSEVTVEWGAAGGEVGLELLSDCDTVSAEPFFVGTILIPSGESFEIPLIDESDNILWQAVPGSSNNLNFTTSFFM